MIYPEYERDHLHFRNAIPRWAHRFRVAPKRPLEALRMALLTTAGLHYRDAEAFEAADGTFRPIDGEEDTAGLVMSHSSVNFDKSGFAEDVNLVFSLRPF